MIAAILAALVVHPRTEHWDYAYQNSIGSVRIFVSKHFFQDLVREKWCIRIYKTKDRVTICVI